MHRDIKFSVIIPTFNRVEFILLAIRSVLLQSYKNLELIIVDDGSTDETESVVATIKDNRIIFIRIDNSERGRARNMGVQIATGDYVTFLDSDDQLYDDYLEEALKGLQKYNYIPFYHQAYEIRSYIKFSNRLIHNYHNRDVKFLVKAQAVIRGYFTRKWLVYEHMMKLRYDWAVGVVQRFWRNRVAQASAMDRVLYIRREKSTTR
jgi:glycosyltransferase involved in cell wall biosynthesis